MHYLLVLPVVAVIAFATGGHSSAFNASYEAAKRGELSKALTLVTTAVQQSLRDADQPRRERMEKELRLVMMR